MVMDYECEYDINNVQICPLRGKSNVLRKGANVKHKPVIYLR